MIGSFGTTLFTFVGAIVLICTFVHDWIHIKSPDFISIVVTIATASNAVSMVIMFFWQFKSFTLEKPQNEGEQIFKNIDEETGTKKDSNETQAQAQTPTLSAATPSAHSIKHQQLTVFQLQFVLEKMMESQNRIEEWNTLIEKVTTKSSDETETEENARIDSLDTDTSKDQINLPSLASKLESSN